MAVITLHVWKYNHHIWFNIFWNNFCAITHLLSYLPIEESLFNFATIWNQLIIKLRPNYKMKRAIGIKTEHILGMLRWWYFEPDATYIYILGS